MQPNTKPYLNISESFTGRFWVGPTPEQDRQSLAITQTTELPEIVARILARLDVAPTECATYLAPSLRDLMPDPSTLRDADAAAERLWSAVQENQRIAIFADYDVDGGSSAALLISWLRDMGLQCTLYVPDRILEGYGPNVPAMTRLGADHDLVICVDCGTLSHEPIAACAADVIVIDHHLAGETLPAAVAVVNPNRHDETSGLGHLCAAGVVFMVLVATNRLIRNAGRKTPDLMRALDLVALATVADVSPLVGLNRAFVRQGLAMMASTLRPGIAALAEAGKANLPLTPYSLGFVIGPRINAGGRVGQADLGARILSTRDVNEAAALAGRLESLNLERRAVEAEVLRSAQRQVLERDTSGPVVWAAGDGWHPGVVGIVASRLKEEHSKPSIVVGFDGDDGKGSGRSVKGIDLGSMIGRLVEEGLIEKGGGHTMAAGMSLTRAQMEPAMDRLSELLNAKGPLPEIVNTLRIDGLVAPATATPDLADQMAGAGPFGAGVPAPRVVIPNVKILRSRPVGESHLSVTLGDSFGGRLDGICFRAFESELGDALSDCGSRNVHVAGRLERDDWGGRSKAKLFVDDASFSDE